MKLGANITHKVTIKKFKELPELLSRVHGDRYDYSKVIYTGVKSKVTIVCKEHGPYTTTMDSHLQGKNCPKCVGGVRSNTTEFITKANLVHNNVYNYSLVDYKNNTTKVKLICPIHGEFLISPNNHLAGVGCKKCKGKLVTNTDELMEFGKIKFPDKHTYEKTIFVSSIAKVIITCKEHGDFNISPNSYQNSKYGCPSCAGRTQCTTTNVIDRFKEIHGDTYDYSTVNYLTMHTKVFFTCTRCNQVISQTPRNHLNGDGCSSCSSNGFNPRLPAILYYLSINNGQAYKIGITNRSVAKRFTVKDKKSITVLKEWFYDKGEDAFQEELRVLREFKSFKYEGVNLLSSGNTELFCCDVLNLDTTG